MSPRISIIMPAFNAAAYIQESIESVLVQTYSHWELLVVDDGSTDQTKEIVASFVARDSRIRYFFQSNGKQGKARNKALAHAIGQYVTFLDADDIWVSGKLSGQIVQMEAHGVDLVFGFAHLMREKVPTNEITGRGLGYFLGDTAVNLHLHGNAFVLSTTLVKTDVVRAVGGFSEDERIQNCEDWHLWLKIALSGYSMFSAGDVLGYYRVYADSSSQVEKEFEKKYFYCFADLASLYPGTIINEEAKKRAWALVYHQTNLPAKLVREVCRLRARRPWIRRAWFALYQLNCSIFRKLFTMVYSQKEA